MAFALVLVRLGQYFGAAGLFGSALFFGGLPVLDGERRERGLVLAAALLFAVATAADLIVQAAIMAGAGSPIIDPSAIQLLLTGTAFGVSVVVRFGAIMGAVGLLAWGRGKSALWGAAALGGLANASLAWGGHAMADEGLAGSVHLSADIGHLLAASLWIGALMALLAMAMDRVLSVTGVATLRFERALAGFSGLGTLAVAVLILTGLANSWFLIGPRHLGSLFTTLYGRLLLAKLALFVAMAGLAAANRWRLTPQLAASLARQAGSPGAVAALRRSLALETGAAMLVLTLVAWLGTLAPPTAM